MRRRRDILATGRGARGAAAAAAKQALEKIRRVESGSATRRAAAEIEMLGAGRSAAAARPSEAARPRAAKGIETPGLAFRVDFAAVELALLFLVAKDFIGGIGLGEFLLGLGIVLVVVGMKAFRQFAIGFLDLVASGRFWHAKDGVGVAHKNLSPFPRPPDWRGRNVSPGIWARGSRTQAA